MNNVTSPTGNGSKSIRKGVERPKPLKCPSVITQHAQAAAAAAAAQQGSLVAAGQAEQVLELYGRVAKDLSVRRYDRDVVANIVALNNGLKVFGAQLEQTHKEVLDRYQAFLRTACRDGSLDLVARLQLLEIIELRAMKWKASENVTNYYKHKLLQVEQCDVNFIQGGEGGGRQQRLRSVSLNANASEFQPPPPTPPPVVSTAKFLASASANLSSLLSVNNAPPAKAAAPGPAGDVPAVLPQGQVIASSGKFDKPSRVPGKPQLLKDEVVIRNADSGKVESGAKERLVQIIGPDETKICAAKGLIEETIQRNKTPEVTSSPEDNNNEANCKTKMADGTQQLYSYTVEVQGGEESIKILGGNADLVRMAKLVLDKHFAAAASANQQLPPAIEGNSNDRANCIDLDLDDQNTDQSREMIRYERRQLLAYSNSPFCRQEPTNWSEHWQTLRLENPSLARNVKKAAGNANVSGDAEVVAEEDDGYFKPSADLFLHKTPRFPEGFVYVPRPYTTANNNNIASQKVSHLDRLFAAGAAVAAADGDAGPVKSPNTLQTLLSNAKVWDERRQEWVSESALLNTRN